MGKRQAGGYSSWSWTMVSGLAILFHCPALRESARRYLPPVYQHSEQREKNPEQIACRDLFLHRLVAARRYLASLNQGLHPSVCPALSACEVLIHACWRWLPLTSCGILGKLSNSSDLPCYHPQNVRVGCLTEFLWGGSQVMSIKKLLITIPGPWQVINKWQLLLLYCGIKIDCKLMAIIIVHTVETHCTQALYIHWCVKASWHLDQRGRILSLHFTGDKANSDWTRDLLKVNGSNATGSLGLLLPSPPLISQNQAYRYSAYFSMSVHHSHHPRIKPLVHFCFPFSSLMHSSITEF